MVRYADSGTSGPEFSGKAANIDILVAAGHAYVNALNRMLITRDMNEVREAKELKLEGASGV